MPKQIFLIDRDPLRRTRLSELLQKQGFGVAEFEAGGEALSHLLFSSVHAVVLDYNSSYEPQSPMPSGKRVAQEIVNVDAFVPLVLICDRGETLDHETAAAADLVLRRPLPEQQIVHGIQTVLDETLRERAQRKSRYIYAFR